MTDEYPAIDFAANAYVGAPRSRVAAHLTDRSFFRHCWPGLELTMYDDRGLDGVRWYVDGPLVGIAEVWLEPYRHGVIAHIYVRADPARGRARKWRWPASRWERRLKRGLFDLKDRLERRDGASVGLRPSAQDDSGNPPT